MRPRTLAAALLLGATPLAARPGAAQARTTPAAPGPRFGILGGLSSATLNFDVNDVNNIDAFGVPSPDRHSGFTGGVYLALPLGGSGFAFRPELLYAQKGATQNFSGSDGVDTYDLHATTVLSYVEVPLLVQYTVPTPGGLHPQLYAGPALGLRTGCRFRLRAVVSGETQRDSGSCDEVTDGGFRRFDLGAAVGGALAFALGGQSLTAGVRYTHGVTNLVTGSDAEGVSVKNRALAVYGSLELPLGRR